MDYQERFVKDKNKLLNHFSEGFDVVGLPKVIDGKYKQELGKGIREYAEDKSYFKLFPKERQSIEGNESFAEDSADRIERNWLNQSVEEIIRMSKKMAKKRIA